MNIQLLIDAVVRQTTVFIAELATSGGVRAPLAHVANQVFLDLASELEQQGVSRRVGADMFGMALRSYLRKIRQLSESSTDRERSLWEAVLDHVSREQVVSRGQVLTRFHRDDAELVRAVLRDLVDSGLVFRAGRGDETSYRAATGTELDQMKGRRDGLEELLWVIVYRDGPVTRDALGQKLRMSATELDEALDRLVSDGRIRRQGAGNDALYDSVSFLVPQSAKVGWEAAMFDHFQAVITTMIRRLRQQSPSAHTGGSTFTFEVWPGHPLAEETLGTLQRLRDSCGDLRQRLGAYNTTHALPPERDRVLVYVGQCVVGDGAGDEA